MRRATLYVFTLVVLPAVLGCALLRATDPAQTAADAIKAENAAHKLTQEACDAYTVGVALKAVKPNADVSSACAARK
jgi:hypothetical protein